MTELALAAPSRRSDSAPADVVKPIVVLKLGSSVISDRARIPEAVTEIYRIVRDGRRVLAVVSAFEGVTDRMLEDARALGCAHDNVHLPRYVALGEETSAALLTLACDRAGLEASTLSVAQLGLKAKGPIESAAPVSLDPRAIEQAFARCDVLVVPGYAALDPCGEVVLLGRGGTDLSAVYLAAELGAERVRLVKDVDGVYDRDPNTEEEALRFGAVSWGQAREVAGKLIQTRALDVAEARALPVEVGALGRNDATLVGPRGAPPAPRGRARRLKIALAGCGVVGGGVLARLDRRPDEFEVVNVLVRDPSRPREGLAAGAALTVNEAQFLDCGADVFVDVLSSAEAGARIGEDALRRGAHLVSANKQAVVGAYGRLLDAASAGGGRLLYSAAVGGGAPLIETVRQARAEGAVAACEGVLNGTVNFVLGRLAGGETLEDALAAARSAGLAEEDPSADLEGFDAAAKVQILAFEAFGETLPLQEIEREALDDAVARAAGVRPLKQVARVERTATGLRASVRFLVETPFTQLRSDRNALRVTGVDGRVWSARGRGAGRWPTTESVLADLVDLHASLSL